MIDVAECFACVAGSNENIYSVWATFMRIQRVCVFSWLCECVRWFKRLTQPRIKKTNKPERQQVIRFSSIICVNLVVVSFDDGDGTILWCGTIICIQIFILFIMTNRDARSMEQRKYMYFAMERTCRVNVIRAQKSTRRRCLMSNVGWICVWKRELCVVIHLKEALLLICYFRYMIIVDIIVIIGGDLSFIAKIVIGMEMRWPTYMCSLSANL